MKQLLLTLIVAILFLNAHAQQINGVFSDFAVNNEWANTAINTATLETSGYITLGGHYEGRSPEKRYPMILQIDANGIMRPDLGISLINSINTSNGSTEVLKTFIATTSSTASSIQFIISGRENGGNGFLFKMFGNGTRPTAFNGGNTINYSGGGATTDGFIQDWVTGNYIYSVHLNGISLWEAKVHLSNLSKQTGLPLSSFGENGTLRISAPEGNIIDPIRPCRIVLPTTGSHTNKFYVAFSTLPSIGPGSGITVCRINKSIGTIDSSFGSNGYKTFPTTSRYYVTSILANNDESITVGGYGGDGFQSVPSFFTFKADESVATTSFNYLVGQPNPGYGSKNIGAAKATINGQERIVFVYAHPINTNNQYRIAIASLTPSNGAAADPLLHTAWLGSGFTSAEPTSIIALSGNSGFIVTGKATRVNGSLAGIVLKYTHNGTLDPTFGTQGVLIINARGGGPQWRDATQLSTGKYLAVGGAEFIPGNLTKKAILLNRFHANGSIDSSFGFNGSLYHFQSDNARDANEILALPNGEYLVSGSYFSTLYEPGTSTSAADNEGILCKFNSDGSPQLSFGPFNNGRYHFPSISIGNMKVIANNIYITVNPYGQVQKLSLNGNAITNYASTLSLIQDYTLDESTGNIFAGGNRSGVTAKQVTKIRSTGTIDPSYGANGYVNMPMISSDYNTNIRDLKLKPDASLLAVIAWSSPGYADYGVFFSSISEAGVLDMGFGTNGIKFLELPGASKIMAHRYKWTGAQNDKFIIFGQATVNNATQGFVCRLDLNGDLDAAFGNNGVIWTTETFVGTIGFDNNGNALAIKDYGFFGGSLAKLSISADVYNHIKPGSWIGSIDNDWFKPGNWAENTVPDAYTAVNILNGNVLIGGNRQALAWSVNVANGADITVEANSSLELTDHNP